MLIPPLITAATEQMLNRLLFNAEHTHSSLKAARYRLIGKCLRLELKELPTPLLFIFSSHQVDVVSQWAGDVDCSVTTDIRILYKLCQHHEVTQLIRQGELDVAGDLSVLQHLQQLIELLEWDPAEWLAPYLGDVVAQGVSVFAQRGATLIHTSINKHRQYLQEALVEEWRLAPGTLEFANFCDDITLLVQQFDDLMTRVERLDAK